VLAVAAEFDPRRILRTLGEHKVRFVLIGGQAATAQGSTSLTADIDIVYARDRENLAHLASALAALGASLRGADQALPFRPDAETLRRGLNFTFSTRFGPLDCLGEAAGAFTFEALARNADSYDIAEINVQVAALDDLIAMKRAAGRPKDLIEVENLAALREVREGRGRRR